jgi:DeoR/GlpR family transcriptional regulator of sugar metabolism
MRNAGANLDFRIARADEDSGHLPAARQARLVGLIRDRGQMTVNEMMSLFSVSRDTIRRDLTALEDRALITRTHGGAVPADRTISPVTTLSSRMDSHAAAKRSIGAATARLIRDGETLVLNGGSTTTYFAAELKDHHDLTIITNNLRVLSALPEHCTRSVYLLGGTYAAATQVLVRFDDLGPMPRINVRTAIIGVTGLSAGGFSSGTIQEAQATKAMIDRSQRTILLSDHRKFNVAAFANIAELRKAAYLVTDRMPDEELRAALEKAEVEVLISEPLNG